ncbi:hypothetical protein GCM10022261_31440 [Brevibacterium daeguense]|uniref:Uncharacterized protein n=1 Tax=Brevibacterium daeguense TaxID=909936 RepID=A0ABP8EPJ7_9MICO|nr:hypothetical protein [Brevibacterium daeguense]
MAISRSERATATGLLFVSTFQSLLASGAPWGRAAYGGTTDGVLPGRLRVISAVAALGYGTGAILVLRGSGSPRNRARAFTALSAFMGLGVIVNGASRSPSNAPSGRR